MGGQGATEQPATITDGGDDGGEGECRQEPQASQQAGDPASVKNK